MKRRDFVKSTAASIGAATLAGGVMPRSASAQATTLDSTSTPVGQLPSKPNIVLLITDQQRAEQHFPENWSQEYTPAMLQLQLNGLTFNKAYCPSAMCSPSRSSLFTGLYPAQHGVTQTLSEGCSQSASEVVLDPTLPNLATVLQAAGYRCFYKGKWHMSKAAGVVSQPSDVGQYGFENWDPPDAGGDTALYNFGGGIADNDARFIDDALNFINTYDDDKPFCLVVSLVNPHDTLSYPNTYLDGGYTDGWLEGPVGLPSTVGEDLRANYKPDAQWQYLITLAAGLGTLPTDTDKTKYLNFYANLLQRIDNQIGSVIDALRNRGFIDDTLIVRTSDHGEMGMAHGGLRQKSFNMYDEALRVPLVFSNPKLYSQAFDTDQLISLVDLLPTLATLADVPNLENYTFIGRDMSSVLLNPRNAPTVQENILFTYDDIRCGQCLDQVVPPPNRMHTLIETNYKYSVYYDGNGQAASQYEMYDLVNDPPEMQNVANTGNPYYDDYTTQRARLEATLAAEVNRRLQPLPSGPVRYFGTLSTLDNGWYTSPWFGAFYGVNFPWIYQDDLGWLFCGGTGAVQNEFWFYDLAIGWFYTNSTLYPTIYSYYTNSWLYYEVGTSDPRAFYDFTTAQWITLPGPSPTVSLLGHPGSPPDWFHGEKAMPDRPVGRPQPLQLNRETRQMLAAGSPWKQNRAHQPA